MYALAAATGVELDEALVAYNDAKLALDAANAAMEEEAQTPETAAEGDGEGDATTGEGDATEGEGDVTEGEGEDNNGAQEPAEPTKEEILAAAQKAYDEARAKVNELYNKYDEQAAVAKAAAEDVIKKFDFASTNLPMLDTNEAFNEAIRNELKAIVTDLADEFDALKAFLANEIAALETAVDNFAQTNVDVLDVEEEIVEDEKNENTDSTTDVFNKYAVTENTVVYEKYDNGKTFVLNFNNYAIKVMVDGAYYTVGAYGYIIIA